MSTIDKDVPTTEETAEMVELEQLERAKETKAKDAKVPSEEHDREAD